MKFIKIGFDFVYSFHSCSQWLRQDQVFCSISIKSSRASAHPKARKELKEKGCGE